MITELRIRDFQALGDVQLQLGAFTALVGPSDTGKSAVVRALQALLTNPAGTDVVRKGSKTASVAVIADGQAVVWEKRGSTAYYSVPGQDEEVRARSSVPEEVSQHLRLAPLTFGGRTFNPAVHSQLEPPFLVYEPSAGRAALFGELSGASGLTLAAAEARRRSLSAKRDRDSLQALIDELATTLANYDALDSLGERLALLRQADVQLDEGARSIESLAADLVICRIHADNVERLRPTTTLVEPDPVPPDPGRDLQATLSELRSWMATVSDLAGALWSLRVPDPLPEESRLGADVVQLKQLIAQRDRLALEATNCRDELADLMVQIAVIPTCPTCGRPL